MHSRIGAAIAAFTVIILTNCSGTPQSNLTPGNGNFTSLRMQPAIGRYQHARSLSAETVLHSFKTGAPHDGANPEADLVLLNGTLYGTTLNGGRTGCGGAGCGTVFSITPSGAETVLYRFKGGTDGGNPNAGLALTNLKGDLYGTTEGTVFKITTAGKEKVLHIFTGYTDGALPEAGLTNVGGTLYGTTVEGGGGGTGYGTVYSLSP